MAYPVPPSISQYLRTHQKKLEAEKSKSTATNPTYLELPSVLTMSSYPKGHLAPNPERAYDTEHQRAERADRLRLREERLQNLIQEGMQRDKRRAQEEEDALQEQEQSAEQERRNQESLQELINSRPPWCRHLPDPTRDPTTEEIEEADRVISRHSTATLPDDPPVKVETQTPIKPQDLRQEFVKIDVHRESNASAPPTVNRNDEDLLDDILKTEPKETATYRMDTPTPKGASNTLGSADKAPKTAPVKTGNPKDNEMFLMRSALITQNSHIQNLETRMDKMLSTLSKACTEIAGLKNKELAYKELLRDLDKVNKEQIERNDLIWKRIDHYTLMCEHNDKRWRGQQDDMSRLEEWQEYILEQFNSAKEEIDANTEELMRRNVQGHKVNLDAITQHIQDECVEPWTERFTKFIHDEFTEQEDRVHKTLDRDLDRAEDSLRDEFTRDLQKLAERMDTIQDHALDQGQQIHDVEELLHLVGEPMPHLVKSSSSDHLEDDGQDEDSQGQDEDEQSEPRQDDVQERVSAIFVNLNYLNSMTEWLNRQVKRIDEEQWDTWNAVLEHDEQVGTLKGFQAWSTDNHAETWQALNELRQAQPTTYMFEQPQLNQRIDDILNDVASFKKTCQSKLDDANELGERLKSSLDTVSKTNRTVIDLAQAVEKHTSAIEKHADIIDTMQFEKNCNEVLLEPDALPEQHKQSAKTPTKKPKEKAPLKTVKEEPESPSISSSSSSSQTQSDEAERERITKQVEDDAKLAAKLEKEQAPPSGHEPNKKNKESMAPPPGLQSMPEPEATKNPPPVASPRTQQVAAQWSVSSVKKFTVNPIPTTFAGWEDWQMSVLSNMRTASGIPNACSEFMSSVDTMTLDELAGNTPANMQLINNHLYNGIFEQLHKESSKPAFTNMLNEIKQRCYKTGDGRVAFAVVKQELGLQAQMHIKSYKEELLKLKVQDAEPCNFILYHNEFIRLHAILAERGDGLTEKDRMNKVVDQIRRINDPEFQSALARFDSVSTRIAGRLATMDEIRNAYEALIASCRHRTSVLRALKTEQTGKSVLDSDKLKGDKNTPGKAGAKSAPAKDDEFVTVGKKGKSSKEKESYTKDEVRQAIVRRENDVRNEERAMAAQQYAEWQTYESYAAAVKGGGKGSKGKGKGKGQGKGKGGGKGGKMDKSEKDEYKPTCHACGSKDHMMWECTQFVEMRKKNGLKAGAAVFDDSFQLAHPVIPPPPAAPTSNLLSDNDLGSYLTTAREKKAFRGAGAKKTKK